MTILNVAIKIISYSFVYLLFLFDFYQETEHNHKCSYKLHYDMGFKPKKIMQLISKKHILNL